MSKAKGEKPKPDDAEQSRRFEEAAREVGTDESEESFSKVLGKVVPSTPKRSLSEPVKQ